MADQNEAIQLQNQSISASNISHVSSGNEFRCLLILCHFAEGDDERT